MVQTSIDLYVISEVIKIRDEVSDAITPRQ
jgi:hypothetical protein